LESATSASCVLVMTTCPTPEAPTAFAIEAVRFALS
jgi:hypothetical protein